jgi:hypothetical protein
MHAVWDIYNQYDLYSEAEEVMQRVINDVKEKLLEIDKSL